MDRDSFILQREKLAREYFSKGYNCCQSVLMAFGDITGLDNDTLARLGSGLGGGVARMRELCGSVSGMAIISGFIISSVNPEDTEKKKANYALMQEMAAEFSQKNGSIVCRELLGLRSREWQEPAPSERNGAYYTTRPCERLVGDAAAIVAGRVFDVLKP